MAAREHHPKKTTSSFSSSRLLFIFILCLTTLFITSSLFKTSPKEQPGHQTEQQSIPETTSLETDGGEAVLTKSSNSASCDYSDGRWIYDPTADKSLRYDQTCKEIFKGWNCIGSNKFNAIEIVKWRWKPYRCELPQFDPLLFLKRFANTNIGFVGDSLNRNMFVSLFCTLRQISSEVKKWRPVGADRGFTFLKYNLTISYHRTNLLARYGRWVANTNGGVLESLGYKEGYRIDVDIPEGTWEEALSFHNILIFNTGHWWWAPAKFDPVKSPMLFFEKGTPVMPPVLPDVGLGMVLKHMIPLVQKRMRPGTTIFFRTQSPRHFEGGDWDQGGSCQRSQPLSLKEVEEFFSIENNRTNVEARLVNEHLYNALKGSGFHILDVTHTSEYRADAHPSTAGGKKHDDCMHWCLPGVIDTWNDLFIARLNNMKSKN